MGQKYANIIIDIPHESADRVFQYKVPQELKDRTQMGHQVYILFEQGSRRRKGRVAGLTDQTGLDENKLKGVAGITQGSATAKSQLIWLVW